MVRLLIRSRSISWGSGEGAKTLNLHNHGVADSEQGRPGRSPHRPERRPSESTAAVSRGQ